MPKQIKIHDKVYADLTAEKKEGETYSEVITRLLVLIKLFRQVEREKAKS